MVYDTGKLLTKNIEIQLGENKFEPTLPKDWKHITKTVEDPSEFGIYLHIDSESFNFNLKDWNNLAENKYTTVTGYVNINGKIINEAVEEGGNILLYLGDTVIQTV